MTKTRRISEFITGLLMLVTAALILSFPKEGYYIVILLLSLNMIVSGMGNLIYYFSMSRYAVGGRISLYKGVILLDFGMLTASISDIPHFYILLYLIIMHGFSGIIDVLRTRESIQLGAKSWKLNLAQGIFNLLISVLCIILIRQTNTASIIYAIGLAVSAIGRIINAFRRKAFVFVR